MSNENNLGFIELFKSDLPKISPRNNPVGHKYSSASKVLNYQRLLGEYSMHQSVLMAYPYSLNIEPTNACRLKCPLCPPVRLRRQYRRTGMMPFANFKQILDEMSPYLFFVELYGWGEPFDNPDIFKMIRYAHDHKIMTSLSSHFNFLTEEQIGSIVKSGLDFITLSIDGSNQKEYSSYRIGGNFDNVLGSLRLLMQNKKEQQTTFPITKWQYLISENNSAGVEAARDLAKETGVDIFSAFPMIPSLGKGLSEVSSSISPAPKNNTHGYSCDALWKRSSIGWDGTVFPCPALYAEIHSFGNVFSDGGLKTIWNSAKYVRARQTILGQNSIQPSDVICSRCDQWLITHIR